MLFEPLTGWRAVEVRDKHTRSDWTEVVYKLITEYYPNAQQITIVQDNLSAHKPYAFYELLAAEKARDLLKKLNFVYTPKQAVAAVDLRFVKKTKPRSR